MKRPYNGILSRITGWKKIVRPDEKEYSSTYIKMMVAKQAGSNRRRAFSRVLVLVSILLFIEAFIRPSQSPLLPYFAFFLLGVSFWFFIWVVIGATFRRYFIHAPSAYFQDGRIDAFRLLLDTLVSSVFAILVFALFYRHFHTKPCGTALDNIYFSAVTFSTLGFGDYSPIGYSKPFAAIQALLGNLHLGVIVGAAFAAISTDNPSIKRTKPVKEGSEIQADAEAVKQDSVKKEDPKNKEKE